MAARTTRPTRRAAALVALAAVAGLLAGCSGDGSSVAEQARSGDRKGYVSGDGTIERLAADERGSSVALAGTTLEGDPWSLKDKVGDVVVVNVWGSWCPPCIEETPELVEAHARFEDDPRGVHFIGVDIHESAESGLAFQKANDVTYPSLAYDGGVPLLSLQGTVAATPTTLVLDGEGRIAARVSGPVSTATLVGLVDDVLAETA